MANGRRTRKITRALKKALTGIQHFMTWCFNAAVLVLSVGISIGAIAYMIEMMATIAWAEIASSLYLGVASLPVLPVVASLSGFAAASLLGFSFYRLAQDAGGINKIPTYLLSKCVNSDVQGLSVIKKLTIKFLIKLGADIHARNGDYYSDNALTLAISTGNQEMVKYMIAASGVLLNLLEAKDQARLLDCAVLQGNKTHSLEMAEFLAHDYNICYRGYGSTAQFPDELEQGKVAAYTVQKIEFLIRNGVQIHSANTFNPAVHAPGRYRSLLGHLIENGDVDLVQSTLNAYEANPKNKRLEDLDPTVKGILFDKALYSGSNMQKWPNAGPGLQAADNNRIVMIQLLVDHGIACDTGIVTKLCEKLRDNRSSGPQERRVPDPYVDGFIERVEKMKRNILPPVLVPPLLSDRGVNRSLLSSVVNATSTRNVSSPK